MDFTILSGHTSSPRASFVDPEASHSFRLLHLGHFSGVCLAVSASDPEPRLVRSCVFCTLLRKWPKHPCSVRNCAISRDISPRFFFLHFSARAVTFASPHPCREPYDPLSVQVHSLLLGYFSLFLFRDGFFLLLFPLGFLEFGLAFRYASIRTALHTAGGGVRPEVRLRSLTLFYSLPNPTLICVQKSLAHPHRGLWLFGA